MPAMNPIFADSIDFPIALVMGFVVLVPLLLFEVIVEAFVLKGIWSIPFRTLCRYTFIANVLSLLAGIPVKILNACLYDFILPQDLPGFFTRYPWAVALGSLVYFVVTVGVEGAYAFRWLRRKQLSLGSGQIWKGALIANLASYAVLAPFNYYITRPAPQQIREFTKNANWSSHPAIKLIFIGGTNGGVQSMQLGSATSETIVPKTVKDDYLLSADLELCLFRSTNDALYLYRRTPAQCKFVMQSDYHFMMDRAAFSPSGRYFAYADELNNRLELSDLETGEEINQPLNQQMPWEGSVAWSTNESIFYVGLGDKGIIQCTIKQTGLLLLETLTQTNPVQTNATDLLTCFGQLRDGGYTAMIDDGGSVYNRDSFGDLTVYTVPGLGSCLVIYSGTDRRNEVESFSVNPGLLHMSRFGFADVAFLDRNECLFDANGYTYLLDIQNKRVGTVAHGDRFITLTPRYQRKP